MEQAQSGSHWWPTCGVMLGALTVSLTHGVLNVAVPNMMSSLGTDLDRIQWVQTAYQITQAVVMPAVGWLGARLGPICRADPGFPRAGAVHAGRHTCRGQRRRRRGHDGQAAQGKDALAHPSVDSTTVPHIKMRRPLATLMSTGSMLDMLDTCTSVQI